jgi:hypothetical protein
MSKQNDPLEALISSDAKATDRNKLAELLGPFMVIDQDSKEFSFHPAFHEVKDNDTKIQILLAGAKARALYFNLPDGLFPGEVIAMGLMPDGSVKTSLKRLFDKHQIKKNKEGRYFFPAYRIQELTKKLADIKT